VEGGDKGWQRGGVGVAVPEDLGLGSLSERLKNHGFAESVSGAGGGSAEEEGGGGFNIGSIGLLGRRQVNPWFWIKCLFICRLIFGCGSDQLLLFNCLFVDGVINSC